MKRIILRLTVAIITSAAILLVSYKTVQSLHTDSLERVPHTSEQKDLVVKALDADAVAGGSALLRHSPMLLARTGQ